jgi:hypothetical protein
MNAREIREMNARIEQRWQVASRLEKVPVRPPAWAAYVVEGKDELLAVHEMTGAPYPLSLHEDLDPEERAKVIVRRLIAAGASREEVERFVRVFEVDRRVESRLLSQIRDGFS